MKKQLLNGQRFKTLTNISNSEVVKKPIDVRGILFLLCLKWTFCNHMSAVWKHSKRMYVKSLNSLCFLLVSVSTFCFWMVFPMKKEEFPEHWNLLNLPKKMFRHFQKMFCQFPSTVSQFLSWSINFHIRSNNFDKWSINFDRWSISFHRWSINFYRRSINFPWWSIIPYRWSMNFRRWSINSYRWCQ